MSAADVAAMLAERIETLVTELVGDRPISKSGMKWRFYPRGA